LIDDKTQEPILFSILNNFDHGTGQGHFCPILPYRKGVGELVLSVWRKLGVRLVWGKTPAQYDRVLRLIKLLGFTILGEIPGSCWIEKEKRAVSGCISYLELKGE